MTDIKRLRALCNEAWPSDVDILAALRKHLPEALDEIERLREALRIAMLRWFHESPSDVYDPDSYEDVELMLDGPTENSNDDWQRCKAALLGWNEP